MSTSPASAGGPPENMKELKVSLIDSCLCCGDTSACACHFKHAIKLRDKHSFCSCTIFPFKEEKNQPLVAPVLGREILESYNHTMKQWVKKQMLKVTAVITSGSFVILYIKGQVEHIALWVTVLQLYLSGCSMNTENSYKVHRIYAIHWSSKVVCYLRPWLATC